MQNGWSLALVGDVVQVKVSEVLPPAMSQAMRLYVPLIKTALGRFVFVASGARSTTLRCYLLYMIISITGKKNAD